MNKLTTYLRSLTLIFIGLFCVTAAYACSCLITQTCSRISPHDAMFLGKAMHVTIVQGKKEDVYQHRVYRFLVVESFKGPQRVGDQIDVVTGMGGGDCGYGFAIGDRYLVDAFENSQQLHTGICQVTAPEKRATVLLRELRLEAMGKRLPDLSGRVAIDSSQAFPITGASKDLPGIPVKALNVKTKAIRRATTDLEGIYTFDSLDPGVYDISPDLSTAFTTDRAGLTTPGDPVNVTVPVSGPQEPPVM